MPENNKVLVFFVRDGGEFQLKQGFSPAFTVEPKEDVDIGYEQQYDDLNVVVAIKNNVNLSKSEKDKLLAIADQRHKDEVRKAKSKKDAVV
ncbi:hypothetical protein, partial [Staphylococcus aureus]|uniref:hypothetical protein n=1 Tax=Staphylococcus aureus TaxID=1280 RepID=UPI003520F687